MALLTDHSGRLSQSAKTVAAGLVLAALLIALPITGSLTTDTVQAASSSDLKERLTDVRSQLDDIRENIAKAGNARKAAQGDIAALDQSIAGAEEDLAEAEAAREAAEEKLAALQEQVVQVTADLSEKGQELTKTENDLADQQEVYNDRVVDVYKSGGRVAYLEILLESASIADVVSRATLVVDIVEQDNNILGQIKTLKALVEEQKLSLENERAHVASLEQDQAEVAEELQAAAEQRQAALDELESARAAKEKVLAAAQKDEAAWRAQEDELLAESDRITELLRAASSTKPVVKGSGVLSWPVDGAVTSGFGYRIHPIFNVRKMHTGIDIDADMGDPIRAASGGEIVSAGWRGGYGKCVVISHGGGLATLYGHMSEILVSAGDKVEKGEVIGKVGSTGYSTGPHLHFEVRVNGDPVNPLGYL